MSTKLPMFELGDQDEQKTMIFGPTGTHRSMIITQLAEDAGISYQEMEKRVSLQSPTAGRDKARSD
jgi:hypothetical protein